MNRAIRQDKERLKFRDELILWLCSVIAEAKRENTDEFMEYLAEAANNLLCMIGAADRLKYDSRIGQMLVVIGSQTFRSALK